MKYLKTSVLCIQIAVLAAMFAASSHAQDNRYQIVIEESFYVVKTENKDKFLQVYREKLYPFWSEMQKVGLIVDEYKLYSQRVHTLEPLWTFKTVVKFKNYQSIDTWLEKRDEVYDKLFPGEGGYKAPRKEIDLITEEHWDEFIRELPLKN
jgi:putative SOS response-associated peptidase YedK